MNVNEAKELLSFHSGRNTDINNIKWKKGFLGILRPFKGTLSEENFVEVMECLKVLKNEFKKQTIEKEIVADIVGITYMTKVWISPNGMLGRNDLLTKEQTQQLSVWIDIIEECFMYLLDGAEEDAFFSYNEYLDNRYIRL